MQIQVYIIFLVFIFHSYVNAIVLCLPLQAIALIFFIILLIYIQFTSYVQVKFATCVVSIYCMSVRMKAISLRAFSNIIFGSSEVQRKQFGAKTMARLDESILVQLTTSVWENCCKKCTK